MRSPWYKKLSVVLGPRPPLNWMLLCVVSVFVLIALLGSSSSSTSFNSVSLSAIPDTYRKLKEQAASDYFELRTLSTGSNKLREVVLCGKDKEIYVPCYNLSANLLAGFKDGEEFDRHCEVSHDQQRCLVRPPKDYKIPLTWPTGRDVIWSANVKLSKDQFLSSGTMTKRLMLLEENQIAFHSEDGMNEVNDNIHLIADMIGLTSDSELYRAGVRTVLDIGCGFGSFGSRLLSLNVMAVCVASYELTGSQVQVALERGLPAIIGNFISRQLPFPSLSYDMIHCAQCGIEWDKKDRLFLIEVDRMLKPGGYFVLTPTVSRKYGSSSASKKGSMVNPVEEIAQKMCWKLLAEQEETFVWQKTSDALCYASGQNDIPVCKGENPQSYYQPLAHCLSGTASRRWNPIQNRSSGSLSSAELEVYGVLPDDYVEDLAFWRSSLRDYWSLLSPLIFSDHPKRPGDEDPLPPYNMVRNVMDMNAHYGGFNAALLEARKSAWVMNVVPVGADNTLPLILDRGFAGVHHDWCEPFPTYPRTYDLIHGHNLLSRISASGCSLVDLLFEMDRILRPEGWVILSDTVEHIEKARMIATQIRWEARVIELENGSDRRLLGARFETELVHNVRLVFRQIIPGAPKKMKSKILEDI